jgi:hypothetical protein
VVGEEVAVVEKVVVEDQEDHQQCHHFNQMP